MLEIRLFSNLEGITFPAVFFKDAFKDHGYFFRIAGVRGVNDKAFWHFGLLFYHDIWALIAIYVLSYLETRWQTKIRKKLSCYKLTATL
jgi:hypothetical protein